MNKSEQKRFDELYPNHPRALKLHGRSDKAIDAYSRAVRRIAAWSDCCLDRLEPEQLAGYFSELVESHLVSRLKCPLLVAVFLPARAGSRQAVDRDGPAAEGPGAAQ